MCMISSILMYCYKHKGLGSRLILPIVGATIDFIGKIYVDNTDLIVTRPDLTTSAAIMDAKVWASSLNNSGSAIKPEKAD